MDSFTVCTSFYCVSTLFLSANPNLSADWNEFYFFSNGDAIFCKVCVGLWLKCLETRGSLFYLSMSGWEVGKNVSGRYSYTFSWRNVVGIVTTVESCGCVFFSGCFKKFNGW